VAPAVRAAVPEPVTLVGVTDAVSPEEGALVRETTLLNPFIAVTVIVEVPEDPVEIVMVDGLAVSEKSGIVVPKTVTDVMAEFTSLPLK
jgi:hypothetical protein